MGAGKKRLAGATMAWRIDIDQHVAERLKIRSLCSYRLAGIRADLQAQLVKGAPVGAVYLLIPTTRLSQRTFHMPRRVHFQPNAERRPASRQPARTLTQRLVLKHRSQD